MLKKLQLYIFTFNLLFGITHLVCLLRRVVKTLRYRKDGDIIIGGIFPFHECYSFRDRVGTIGTKCSGFDIYTYRNAALLKFFTEEINPIMFPNISLGFEMYSSGHNIFCCVESAFLFMSHSDKPVPNYSCGTPTPISAMIGEREIENSVTIARLLGLYHVPQVSYGIGDASLSDHYQFPSFLRTVPSTTDVYDGVIQLLLHFHWTWVVVVNHLDSNEILMNKLTNAGICVELLYTNYALYSIYHKLIENGRKLSSTVILASTFDEIHSFLTDAAKLNITGINWIGLDNWPMVTVFSSDPLFNDILHGSFCFAASEYFAPGYETFLYSIHPFNDLNDVFTRKFWETVHSCSWDVPKSPGNNLIKNNSICSGKENLHNLNNNELHFFSDLVSSEGYAVVTAIFSVISALHLLKVCSPGKGPFVNKSCAQFPHFQPWQLFHYLQNVNFTLMDNLIFFTEEGYTPTAHYIVNRQSRKGGPPLFQQVGYYDTRKPVNDKFYIEENVIKFNSDQNQVPRSVCSEDCLPGYRKAPQVGKQVCCFTCVSCAEGEMTNQSGSIGCLVCPPEEWPNDRKDKCIPKRIEFLSYQEPLGVALTSIITTFSLILLAVFVIFVKFCKTPIVKANNEYLSYLLLVSLLICLLCSLIFIGHPKSTTCRFRHIVFGVSFALSVSCVLAKTIMVVVAFNATKPNSHFRRWVGPQLSYIIVSLCTLVQVFICVVWIIYHSPFPVQDLKSQTGMIIMECNEGSTIAFWCMLGYMGLLASVCFTVAFFSRHLPDAFNEAKFITFSMVIFLTVWLAFIPAYLSTKGKYIVAVEAFAIIASSFGLLTCIFFPKCYIILMKPNKNIKVYLRDK